MINSSLPVYENKLGSHSKFGWEEIIVKIIDFLNNKNKKIINCIWGNHAKIVYNKLKSNLKYKIITTHPSPFSYKKGFEHDRIFSIINEILDINDIKTINWER